MPNWCEDRLKIKGRVKEIKKFIDECFTEGMIDFNKIIPEPKTIEECPKKYQMSNTNMNLQPCDDRPWFNWYDWHVDNWGTKWDASCDDRKIEDDLPKDWKDYDDDKVCEINYYFETAWSPPIPIVKKLLEKYPKLNITLYYYEPGMCFAGTVDKSGILDCNDTKAFAIAYMGYDEESFNYDDEDEECED